MAKIIFVFIAATLLTIFAAGSVLMAVFSTAAKNISTETSDIAASFSSTFLNATLIVIILIATVFILTGRKLPI